MPGSPEGENEYGERRPRRELNAVTKLFEGKGLFTHDTPKGEDPKWYPLEAISDLLEDISIRAEQQGRNKAGAEELVVWEESIRKLKMAYEIIVCPYLDYPPYLHIIELSVRDAQNHPNINSRENPRRAPIELNDEEQSVLPQKILPPIKLGS